MIRRAAVVAGVLGCVLWAAPAPAQATATLSIRGRAQTLHLYGSRGGTPVIVSSGDGGWIHLGPHVASVLAGQGCFVVGFDVKAYLSSFTSGAAVLRPDDEPGDYRALAEFAAKGSVQKPVLIGVSEGAGLSLLAATDPATRDAIAGVLGLGLPDITELGWRWKDAIIYITHQSPSEPTFSTAAFAARVAPAPLAAIQSTHDEFVPLDEVQRIMSAAREPKKLWVVPAADHRFSDNLAEFDRRLLEAMAWIQANVGR
ncbi:MAG: alpha/beta hydrolase [Acidobacteria bacterium]|nr:alpha/beta hydrolase [Acidobacteriota bacterium]